MHASDSGRDAGGQDGAGRYCGRLPGIDGVKARGAAGLEGTRAAGWPVADRWRRRHGILGSTERGVSRHTYSALLVPQAGQCGERAAGLAASQGESGHAENLHGSTRADALAVFEAFVTTYKAKYPKAAEKLT